MWVTAPDGARLHVLDQGKGAPILWLQGLNAPAAAWAVQLAHFSQSHRSLAPDLRGVGQSEAPRGPYTAKQLAQDGVQAEILDLRPNLEWPWRLSPAPELHHRRHPSEVLHTALVAEIA